MAISENTRDFYLREFQQPLEINSERTQAVERVLNQYEDQKKFLSELPQTLKKSVLVPVGSKGYLRGNLVHTNEVLHNIGCNYLVKRTSKQALDACDRKIADAKLYLKKLEEEKKWLEQRLEAASKDDTFGGDEQIEIIEDYDEEKEKEWRVKHKENIKKMKELEAEEREKRNEDENYIWNVLDELELKEELEEFEATHNITFDDENDITDTDDDLSQSEESDTYENAEDIETQSSNKTDAKLKETEKSNENIISNNNKSSDTEHELKSDKITAGEECVDQIIIESNNQGISVDITEGNKNERNNILEISNTEECNDENKTTEVSEIEIKITEEKEKECDEENISNLISDISITEEINNSGPIELNTDSQTKESVKNEEQIEQDNEEDLSEKDENDNSESSDVFENSITESKLSKVKDIEIPKPRKINELSEQDKASRITKLRSELDEIQKNTASLNFKRSSKVLHRQREIYRELKKLQPEGGIENHKSTAVRFSDIISYQTYDNVKENYVTFNYREGALKENSDDESTESNEVDNSPNTLEIKFSHSDVIPIECNLLTTEITKPSDLYQLPVTLKSILKNKNRIMDEPQNVGATSPVVAEAPSEREWTCFDSFSRSSSDFSNDSPQMSPIPALTEVREKNTTDVPMPIPVAAPKRQSRFSVSRAVLNKK